MTWCHTAIMMQSYNPSKSEVVALTWPKTCHYIQNATTYSKWQISLQTPFLYRVWFMNFRILIASMYFSRLTFDRPILPLVARPATKCATWRRHVVVGAFMSLRPEPFKRVCTMSNIIKRLFVRTNCRSLFSYPICHSLKDGVRRVKHLGSCGPSF